MGGADEKQFEVAIGGGKSLAGHHLRGEVLGELHARPFTAIETPQRLLHFAFLKTGAPEQSDRTALEALCRSRGLQTPPAGARHMRWQMQGGSLRWESHNEFSTYRRRAKLRDRSRISSSRDRCWLRSICISSTINETTFRPRQFSIAQAWRRH
jgi:uncharacterized membrane-anchored protein